jgi:1-acylglycerone phosphate reductase
LHARVVEITQGQLDILYNNAGRNYTVPALDMDLKEVELTFNANVFAVMKLCKVFAPLVIKAQGTIVQTGSLTAVMPYVFGSAYNASKAALHMYSDTLRIELAPLGVRVLEIITGGVISNIARTNRTLPPDSYYRPLTVEYEKRLTHSQALGMDTQTYARSCVRQVLGGEGWLVKKRWIWEGKMSWFVWFVWNWLPTLLFDHYFNWNFKVWKVRRTKDGKKSI